MASLALCLVLLGVHNILATEPRNEGLMDKLNNGMKFAKDFLGSESVALKVAEFVVRAFQGNKNPETKRRHPLDDLSNENNAYEENTEKSDPHSEMNKTPIPMAPLRHLVKLFGLQPNQITAVAVNALVFVAQMISTFLSGPNRPLKPRSDDPMTWILNKNSRKLQEMISAAKNESLPENIEHLIKRQGSEDETGCIRLLVCKITPFIVRMQEAVFGNKGHNDKTKPKGNEQQRNGVASVMYRYLPTQDEINEHSDICERRHRDCSIE